MTTNLLIFFAIPLAVIIFSIALQKILKNPFLVSGIIFSILLIIALSFFDTIYLIAAVAYTILSFLTAVITLLFCRWLVNNQICNLICNGNSDDNLIDINDNIHGIGEAKYNCNSDIKAYDDISGRFTGVTGNYIKNYRRR